MFKGNFYINKNKIFFRQTETDTHTHTYVCVNEKYKIKALIDEFY